MTLMLSLRGARKSDVAIQKGNNEIESHTDLFATNVAHLVLAKTVRSEQIRVGKMRKK